MQRTKETLLYNKDGFTKKKSKKEFEKYLDEEYEHDKTQGLYP